MDVSSDVVGGGGGGPCDGIVIGREAGSSGEDGLGATGGRVSVLPCNRGEGVFLGVHVNVGLGEVIAR